MTQGNMRGVWAGYDGGWYVGYLGPVVREGDNGCLGPVTMEGNMGCMGPFMMDGG